MKISLCLFIFISAFSYSQNFGYESRSNDIELLYLGYKNFQYRRQINKLENRISLVKDLFNKNGINVSVRIPLHYRFEKKLLTIEPRVIYDFKEFKLWAQKEFSINRGYLSAFAIDMSYKSHSFIFGWDTSKTIRAAFMYRIKKN